MRYCDFIILIVLGGGFLSSREPLGCEFECIMTCPATAKSPSEAEAEVRSEVGDCSERAQATYTKGQRRATSQYPIISAQTQAIAV